MTGKTHILIGLTAGLALALVLRAQPVDGLAMTAAAGLGALLPDVDTPNSMISNKARPVRIFTFWMSHRTLTHSLAMLAIVTMLAVYIGHVFGAALAVGYGSHIVADMMTTNGIPLFYPLWRRSLHVMPPGLRISTGGIIESWFALLVLIGFVVLVLTFFGVDVGVLKAIVSAT